jgi:hypothetical protein
MGDPINMLALASFATVALAISSAAALKGWREWLALKRLELAGAPMRDIAPPSPAARIEIADLKERVRKLEAIASGVDL